MQCPQCQHENRPGARFCQECAAPLPITCANCGTPLPEVAKFCPDCAHPVAPISGQVPRVDPRQPPPRAYTPAHLAQKILTSRSALEGERKQVTVLFVDVVGSTSLAEGFDPEEMHALMGRAIQLMVDEVHRFEGTVNQFLGDGIMALFGAPIAHEDHARRAVQAALAIQQALTPLDRELRRKRNLGLRVRQGLNTGLVVVGSIGTDLRMDYTAVGDTTNVAARLQQHAEPGSILLSEHTRRLVAGYFTLRPLGEISVKGKADPVAAWEVISAQPARARIDIEADRGLTPFMGREKELDTLLECFAKATAGSGQVALLVGEPGIGKSRLLLELRRRLGDRAHWSEGRALSFGRNIPFHPLVDMLRRLHGIDPSDSEAQVIDKLERGVSRLGAELATTLPFLRHLLSVDPGDAKVAAMDPQLRRGELFDALRRVLLRAAELKPQVLVYEDLHWVDPATEEHLRFIIDSLPNARVLLLLTFRPEYTYALSQRSYQTWVQLNPLSSEEGAQMADALIASRSISAQLRALILEKAEGNPFFVEEVVKSLEETAAVHLGDKSSASIHPDSIVVPDTIQDVIGARIDRLGDELKRVLQLASVIGREFARNLILRLAEAPERADALLQQLKSLELIYEKNLYPEPVYTFKHALTQEVAYASLLLKRRKELHRAIGLAIEELYAVRLADHYELLAHHLVLGEQWHRALDYLLKAGQKAAQANANREALAVYDQALEVAQHAPESARARILADIQESRANACVMLSDFALAHEALQGVLEFARRTGDRAREGRILGQMGLISVWHHRFAIAAEESSQTLVIAAETRDERLETSGLFNLGWMEMALGRVEEAASKFARAQSLGHATGEAFHETESVALLALIARWSGE
jgi:class 3 adenylate cyclase/tetratricopeptide (TPR) repeat protein